MYIVLYMYSNPRANVLHDVHVLWTRHLTADLNQTWQAHLYMTPLGVT